MNEWAAEIVDDSYVLIEPIGAGGMGEVWKARDTRLNRTVAISIRLASRNENGLSA